MWILLAAVGFHSFLASSAAKAAQRRASQMSDRLYSWGSETRTMMEELRQQIRRLDFEIKRRAGELTISPEMSIADILAIHPRMKEVLAGVQLGSCSGCAASGNESLAAGAASYGLDINLIMGEIHRFLTDPDHYQGPEIPRPRSAATESIQIQIPPHQEES